MTRDKYLNIARELLYASEWETNVEQLIAMNLRAIACLLMVAQMDRDAERQAQPMTPQEQAEDPRR